MKKTIYLIRHGITDWNQLQRMQGHADIPLNAKGREQARTLQIYFEKNPVDLFVSSDLKRAQETAQIANQKLNHPILTSPQFREVQLGAIEGLTRDEIDLKFGKQAFDNWTSIETKYFDFSFPEGENTWQAIQRFESGLKSLVADQAFNHAAVCTHGLIMRRYLHSLQPELTEPLAIPNCSIFKIQWDQVHSHFKII